MFTLYQIGFCSVSKVAPVQCEQELIFCCGAGIVPKRFQCALSVMQVATFLFNLKRSFTKTRFRCNSAPIKVFRLDSDRFQNVSDTERSTFNSGAEHFCSGAETASKAAFLL